MRCLCLQLLQDRKVLPLKILCDEIVKNEVLDVLELEYSITDKIVISGYQCIHEDSRLFYMERTQDDIENEFLIADLSEDSVWELDKFENPIFFTKQLLQDDGSDATKQECYVYCKRSSANSLDSYIDINNIKTYKDNNLQLSTCDIYLLIPGKISKEDEAWSNINHVDNQYFEVYRRNIDKCVEEEYNSEFAKNLERKCIGETVIQIDDLTDGLVYRQKALIGTVKHETGFCIMEIMVPNCSIGGNKLLNYYCGNMIKIFFNGEEYNIAGFCEKLGIRMFGKKRSMAFVYNDADKEEIINALANEEFPMGKIKGTFEQKIETENIAQYDTAEVYVSHETMLEKCKTIEVISESRLAYQVIEIFFVELILFQDAAIDKVYRDLSQEGEQQRGYTDVKSATEKYEQLSFDMAQAIRFGDYEQFNFPTVRESAKRVAKNFGIEYIFEKYETNKELLAAMIRANKRKSQEQQDAVKNQFLLLISALATVGTLGDIFYVIYEDEKGGVFCYAASLLLVLIVYGVYKLADAISKLTFKYIATNGKKK